MSTNTTLTADIVLKESFRVLRNNTYFINSLKPQYDNSYAAYGAKAGADIRIRKPMEYTVRTGNDIQVQSNVEEAVTLSRSTLTGVDLKFSSTELTQEIEALSEQYITPAVAVLAADLEFRCLTAAYQSTFNAVALPVTSLDRADILGAGVVLDNFATPRDSNRHVVLNPQGQADIVTDLAGLFQNSEKISRQYDDGMMGQGLGFKFGMSQGVNSMTRGTANTAYVTTGASAEGATTIDVITGSGTFVKGDIITIADVYSLNPLTKQSTGNLQRFVVTTASAGGSVTLQLSPAMNASGPRANVNALAGSGKAIVILGTASAVYSQNLAYHPNAFAFGTVDLEMPDVEFKARRVEDGISMRLVSQYDIKTNSTYFRLDLLSGIVAVEPRKACRIYGF
jgi:hypothetical protein